MKAKPRLLKSVSFTVPSRSPASIKLDCTNISSIVTQNGCRKLNFIRKQLLETGVEIIFMTETHLLNGKLGYQNCIDNSEIALESHSVFRGNKKYRYGVGCLMCI